jgi:hypothetical protein
MVYSGVQLHLAALWHLNGLVPEGGLALTKTGCITKTFLKVSTQNYLTNP